MDTNFGTSQLQLPGDDERQMLRDSLDGTLAQLSGDAASVWSALAAQGVASLGADPGEGGAREIAIVMEALGRAASPAPMLGAALANLAFGTSPGRASPLLARLHAGDARVAFAVGPFDPDPNAGTLTRDADLLTGTLRFVEGAATATDLVVAIGDALAVVDLVASGVTVTETRALGTDGLGEIALANAPATYVELPGTRVADLTRLASLFGTARAYGAARRAFDLAVDYAKQRHQFGQPIGRFQAIQHKLANCLINLEGVRLTVANAAAKYDLDDPDWRFFAAAAFAFASPALRQVSLETHHAFGAIGYAEEHEAPRHFRRVHLDMVARGGWRHARGELSAHLLDGGGRHLPEYDLGPAGNAFRAEVRDWLAINWSAERKAEYESREYHDREYNPEFALDLGKTGWIGLGWPRRHGGQERTPLEQIAFIEEMERADAPRTGVPIQANALMLVGTPEQQDKYLSEILRGEAMHGMGYSEPNSGSDLASLRTTAVRDGDEWVINGQKIWTTTYWGKYLLVATRTDREAKPAHAGISMFIVPTDTKGLTINPSKTMYDGSFSTCFYDDVRLPADALLGEVNGGWKVLTIGTRHGAGGHRRHHHHEGGAAVRNAVRPCQEHRARQRPGGAGPVGDARGRDRGRSATGLPLRHARGRG